MLEEVKSVVQLKIGKKIRCHYKAISNTLGTFSGIGKETSGFISPTASSASPNGDFYFICVDKDHLGRWKLIADRNIQHSISWDTLNSAGVASGSGLPVLIDNEIECVIRFLTGGNLSDKENEWDKHIVSSTMNGSVTAGDVLIWNPAITSLVSTTDNGAPERRVTRGGSTSYIGLRSTVGSSYKGDNVGIRPMLLTASLPSPSFAYHDNKYKTFNNGWKPISTALPSKDTFMSDGMHDLSILNRKEKIVSIPMTSSVLGEGKVFKAKIDYNKYFDINSIDVK